MSKIQDIKNLFHGLNAIIASAYYGFPASKLRVVGVVGTDGKTTTVHLIHFILKSVGKKASMISSVIALVGGKHIDTGFHVTTPNPWLLQKLMRIAVDNHDEYLILEVTSHALDQNRVLGINFLIGILTNITNEHLDYHKTYEDYLNAKEKLLINAKTAILNLDDKSYKYLHKEKYNKIVTYAIKQDADFTPQKFRFNTSLPGEYNLYNCLGAIAASCSLEIDEDKIRKSISKFQGVVGRYEKISTKYGFDIIIDFAHTPNALENVLSTLRPKVKNKLIHVFGAAGLRDRGKRPLMGEISAKYADYLVLTEEDHRTEELDQIISEIAKGCIKIGVAEHPLEKYEEARNIGKKAFFRIPHREDAIKCAITKLANKGDVIILTGKAHEKSLCRGKKEYPWDEREAVNNALAEYNRKYA